LRSAGVIHANDAPLHANKLLLAALQTDTKVWRTTDRLGFLGDGRLRGG
jgi:hypothetical protein